MTGNYQEVRLEQGFELYVQRNERLQISVVPELGAKIISLKDIQSGREWMWHPAGGRKLFRNRPGDDFARSPLVGADECLPTVAPCSMRGRALPDHGEVWSVAWQVDRESWRRGSLRTFVELPVSPFAFERTIELRAGQVRLGYRLRNRGPAAEPYLWALHPLLNLQPGDRLELPATTRSLLQDAAWVDTVDSAIPAGGCSKRFAGPVQEGSAAIRNPATGDQLRFEWNPVENDTLGLWLTRGGWHGHHHLAIEPTNGAPDPLAAAAEQNRCGTIAGGATRTWSVTLQVGP